MGKPQRTIDETIEIINEAMKLEVNELVHVSFWRVDRMLDVEGAFIRKDREASSVFINDKNNNTIEIPIINIYNLVR